MMMIKRIRDDYSRVTFSLAVPVPGGSTRLIQFCRSEYKQFISRNYHIYAKQNKVARFKRYIWLKGDAEGAYKGQLTDLFEDSVRTQYL